ncbi:sugar transferase [Flavobacteriaceae bacterium]|nr:sugar transferase [Flavobacteriaceae bacterium]
MYIIFKRIMDVMFSILAIILLLPLFITITLLLLLTAEGQVLYFQERLGYRNKPFQIWKFATMLKNSLQMGSGTITLKDDFRVTRIGKFLRKTKLNELPQIVNILKGDISFVGPRPLILSSFEVYSENIQSKIYDVQPGLTGIGSIIFRDEESLLSAIKDEDPHVYYQKVIAPYKGELELWYQQNCSFLTDFKILFITAWVVLFPKSKLIYKLFIEIPKPLNS